MAEASGEDLKPWNASQYEAALSDLARLQEQLNGLRATIPSLVSPLTRSGGNKEKVFARTKEVALRSTSNIQAFRDNWTSEQTQELLQKGKESLHNNSDLSKAVGVPKWGWGVDKKEGKE